MCFLLEKLSQSNKHYNHDFPWRKISKSALNGTTYPKNSLLPKKTYLTDNKIGCYILHLFAFIFSIAKMLIVGTKFEYVMSNWSKVLHYQVYYFTIGFHIYLLIDFNASFVLKGFVLYKISFHFCIVFLFQYKHRKNLCLK